MNHRDDLASTPGRSSEPDLKHLLEFKARRNQGDPIRAREMIESLGLKGDRELCIDLAFAEFLEHFNQGDSTAEESICKTFPEYADELRRQIGFHRAMSGLDVESFVTYEPSSSESAESAQRMPDSWG